MGVFDSIKKIGGDVFAPLHSDNVKSMIPGLGDAQAQDKANKLNLSLDQANRAFMERMSNTAYQRAMEDMRKGGLNPMLAYQQGGASVPSTAAAQVAPSSKSGLGKFAMEAFTGISTTQTQAQQAQTAKAVGDSTVQLNAAQTAAEVAKTEQTRADTELKKRELRGKGIKDTLDREGGTIIQKIFDTIKSSAKPDPKNIPKWEIKMEKGKAPESFFNWKNKNTKEN